MKKIFAQSVLIIFCFILLSFNSLGQASFETGRMGISLDQYGAIKITAPNLIIEQINRSSILVGKDSAHVYNYLEDAGTATFPALISPPEYGDFQISGSINNTYSTKLPDVLVNIDIFGWQSSGFSLVRFKITNQETNSFNALIGLEILPMVDGSFGNETGKTDSIKSQIFFSKNTYAGYKFLSAKLRSATMFEWYGAYSKDSLFYKWLNRGKVDTSYAAGFDGSVAVVAQAPKTIFPNGTDSLWVAIAVGDSIDELLSNLDSAAIKIPGINTSVKTEINLPDQFALYQNYPNPFNPSTKIRYSVPNTVDANFSSAAIVKLIVYDILGNEVATLVNEQKVPGSYEVEFNTTKHNLSSGTYFYQLRAGTFIQTKKMILVK